MEYYIRSKLEKTGLKKYLEFVHFACTSEDINNLAIALMIQSAGNDVLLPVMKNLIKELSGLAKKWKSVPMLALTHGQPATPDHSRQRIFGFRKKT